MSDIERVAECVQTYSNHCRHPEREAFKVNRLYDLQAEWATTSFPDADKAGCYVFYDENEGLLYIGKASGHSTLGGRIASYFRADGSGGCRTLPDHNWTRSPKFVQTISAPAPFEAPSLEEYLIKALQPVDNIRK